MIPESIGLNQHELAHSWVNDLVTSTSIYTQYNYQKFNNMIPFDHLIII